MNKRMKTLKKQKGAAIILSIFIILVISLIAAAMTNLQQDQAKSTNTEIYAARAYLSAYSGVELALIEVFPLNSPPATTTCTTINGTLPDDNGFHDCTFKTTCSKDDTNNTSRYTIVSTAICGSGETITRRQITVEAIDI